MNIMRMNITYIGGVLVVAVASASAGWLVVGIRHSVVDLNLIDCTPNVRM